MALLGGKVHKEASAMNRDHNAEHASEPFDATSSEIRELLDGLEKKEAKRRESTLKLISKQKNSDPTIIDKVKNLAAQDPIPYVRQAAANTLRTLGYPVPQVQVIDRSSKPDYLSIAILSIFAGIAIPCFLIFSIGFGCQVDCETLGGAFLFIIGIGGVLIIVGVGAAIIYWRNR
jgi:hypothetical protein